MTAQPIPSSTGAYAVDLLNRGYGVQNVARMCKMHVDGVRLLAPPPRRRVEYAPPRKGEVVIQVAVAPEAATPRSQILASLEPVARRYGLRSADDLKSAKRARRFSWARHEASAFLQDRYSLSLGQIGSMLGGIDHTTVLYGIRKYRERAAWCAVVEAMARAT